MILLFWRKRRVVVNPIMVKQTITVGEPVVLKVKVGEGLDV